MPGRTEQCQNCKQEFRIEPEDFDFYKKIDVPPPTWCPECRIQRRMMFLNERSLYKRECALCSKNIISLYSPESPYTIYCQPCFWSDKWDATEYGREYDFSKPFFTQFKELIEAVPRCALQTMYTSLVNSDYCNVCSYLKNCYLVFNSDYDEDCAYSTYLERSKRAFDIYMGDECELCYNGVNVRRGHRVFFSVDCHDSIDVWFSKNLKGCSYCFGCVNLRNKKYHIFNKPYTKDEYFEELNKFNTGSYEVVQELLTRIDDLNLGFPKKYAEGSKNVNISGDYIYNSKNALKSYEVVGVEDSKFCHFLFIAPTKDSYDLTMWGGNATRMYECMGAGDSTNTMKFSFDCWAPGINIEYSWDLLRQNSNLFGCISADNKHNCVLNKQYSKEDYEALIPKIKEHMNSMPYVDEKGRVYKYGEFFPPMLSLFAYNETFAQEHFQLTEDEAGKYGYKWREPDTKDYKITMKHSDLPDHIKDVQDNILQETIGCEHKGECNEQCTTAFKIIPQELQFYRKMNLPLPRLCPNCRHYQRLKQRNPLKLWHRTCQCAGGKSENSVYKNTMEHFHKVKHCPNEFETSYAPDKKEIIYCEKCYNAEVV